MAGLAIGSRTQIRLLNRFSLTGSGIILLLFYFLAGLLYDPMTGIKNEIPALILIVLSAFLPAVLTGRLFHELTAYRDDASSVYSADLAGSALGFILVTGVSIPLLGIKASIFLITSLIFAGLLFGTIRNKL
jgi:hypothetical protein